MQAAEDEARSLLLETIAFTRKHFRKEETVIFGIAERELSRNLQEQLGAEWATRRGVVID
jgi:hemerythrin-like domain-containing protein